MNEIKTIGDDYLGPVGQFGKAMIELDLREADEAMASGDIVRIVAAYEAMKGCE